MAVGSAWFTEKTASAVGTLENARLLTARAAYGKARALMRPAGLILRARLTIKTRIFTPGPFGRAR